MEQFFSRHEKKMKCFRKHVKKFKKTSNGYVGSEIKMSSFNNARSAFAKGVEYEDVVALYDTSLFENGKTGFLFTDDYVYFKRHSGSPIVIRLSDIKDITYYDETKKENDRGLLFELEDGMLIGVEGFCGIKPSQFITFLKEYIEI